MNMFCAMKNDGEGFVTCDGCDPRRNLPLSTVR